MHRRPGQADRDDRAGEGPEVIDVIEMFDDDGSTWPLASGDRVTLHEGDCPGADECSCEALVVDGPSAFA